MLVCGSKNRKIAIDLRSSCGYLLTSDSKDFSTSLCVIRLIIVCRLVEVIDDILCDQSTMFSPTTVTALMLTFLPTITLFMSQ